jgi:glycosyltransferase involved in cell wall biosynthesis
MKICLISNLFPPISRGGAEKVAERVAHGFRRAGHDVFVISTKPWDGWASFKPKAAEENGLKVYRFYPLNIFYYLNDYKHNALWRMKWHFWDMFNFHSRSVVKKILEKEKSDVVMTHNLKGIGYLIPGAVRKLGIKHVHTLHDVQLSAPSGLILKNQENNWEQKIFLRKWYEAICRRLFNSPDVVVSPSKWLLDFYVEKGFFKNSKKIVLPNPIFSNVIARSEATKQSHGDEIATPHPIVISTEPACSVGRPQASGEISHGTHGVRSLDFARDDNGGELKLLYLGQIEEHKGVLFLVNVLKKIDIDFKLHIAGDGSKMEALKNMVGEDSRFIIHGKLPQEKIDEIFNQVDLTIVPSLCYENSPTVIYESLSFGVPVLAAKIGGVAELVHDGQNGFTFEAGNVEDLARALKNCATHCDELPKMRQVAAKSVENFKIENYIKILIKQAVGS